MKDDRSRVLSPAPPHHLDIRQMRVAQVQASQAQAQQLLFIWRAAVDATHDFLAPADRLAIDRELQGAFLWVSPVLAILDGTSYGNLTSDDHIWRMLRPVIEEAPSLVGQPGLTEVSAPDEAPRDGLVAGFMLLAATGDIDALFVHPAFHSMGVGRALVQHAMCLAKSRGHSGLQTDVNEDNGGATAFYLRMGFQFTGRSDVDDHGRPYPLIHLALDL